MPKGWRRTIANNFNTESLGCAPLLIHHFILSTDHSTFFVATPLSGSELVASIFGYVFSLLTGIRGIGS